MLLGAVADGHLVLGGEGHAPTLRRSSRGAGSDDPVAREVLRYIFAGRDRITLGMYDSSFQTGWHALARHLRQWQTDSGLWDPASVRRARTGRYAGRAAAVLGFVAAAVGAGLGGSRLAAGGPVLIAGAVVFCAGLALARRAWELHRRAPEGSAQWRRVEAFRRYLADPSVTLAEQPLDDEQVRLYTAWAGRPRPGRHLAARRRDVRRAHLAALFARRAAGAGAGPGTRRQRRALLPDAVLQRRWLRWRLRRRRLLRRRRWRSGRWRRRLLVTAVPGAVPAPPMPPPAVPA